MPTARRTLTRPRRQLNEYQYAELLSLRAPLIAGEGFWDRDAPGERLVADQRDMKQMEAEWHEREVELINMWTIGWQPDSPFANYPEKLGRPGTRPPGWWLFMAPHKLKRGEHQWQYLDRWGLWRDGEREAWLAGCKRGKNGPIMV